MKAFFNFLIEWQCAHQYTIMTDQQKKVASKLRADSAIFVPSYLTYDVPIYRIGIRNGFYEYSNNYSIHPFERVYKCLDKLMLDELFWPESNEQRIQYRSNNRDDLFAIDCLCHHIEFEHISFEKKVGKRFQQMKADDVRKLLRESLY
jgi:hypothetical protein